MIKQILIAVLFLLVLEHKLYLLILNLSVSLWELTLCLWEQDWTKEQEGQQGAAGQQDGGEERENAIQQESRHASCLPALPAGPPLPLI